MGVLVGEVWMLAMRVANDRLQEKREGLEAAKQDVERSQREAAELADQLAGELDEARAQINRGSQGPLKRPMRKRGS